MEKKTLSIGTVLTILGIAVGSVATFFTTVAATKAGMNSALDEMEKRSDGKFATKAEVGFLREIMERVEKGVDKSNDGVKEANDKLYEIQRDQGLVRVTNTKLIQVNRQLRTANSKVTTIDDKVDVLADELKKVTDDPKKKKKK